MAAIVAIIFTWLGQAIEIFTEPPAIYFTAVALVGAVVGVARKYVPMRRR